MTIQDYSRRAARTAIELVTFSFRWCSVLLAGILVGTFLGFVLGAKTYWPPPCPSSLAGFHGSCVYFVAPLKNLPKALR